MKSALSQAKVTDDKHVDELRIFHIHGGKCALHQHRLPRPKFPRHQMYIYHNVQLLVSAHRTDIYPLDWLLSILNNLPWFGVGASVRTVSVWIWGWCMLWGVLLAFYGVFLAGVG